MIHEGIEVQVIDTARGLRQIREDWDEVQDACSHEHVFLDHRFQSAWWQDLGHGKSMHTLVLRREGRVEGVVPLMLSRGWEVFPTRGKHVRIADDFRYLPVTRWGRVVPIRRLGFPLSFPSSNVRSHLLLRDDDPSVVEASLRYCRAIRDRWDILSLDGIPAGSRQEELLRAAAPPLGLLRGRARHGRVILHASLPESMDAFLAARSANFRRGLRRARRQLDAQTDALGKIHVREHRAGEIEEGLEKLFALERQSWKVARTRRRELHLALDDRYRGFYRDVGRAFASSDEAQVLVTEAGGRPLNALYSLQRRDTVTCVLIYQAEAFKRQISVAPLWARFFELAIERGLRKVDFNGNNVHLARYADGESRFNRLAFFHEGLYSSSLRAVADAATALSQWLAGRRGAARCAAKQ